VVIILMGVTGCGKTTIGELLAEELGWVYYDGDDFHPEPNVAKMAQGLPLTDEDRFPWLRRLVEEIGRWIAAGEDAVLACSALKAAYRDILASGRSQIHIVYLKGSMELIRQRLQDRVHRYMPVSLLESQFKALEEPEDAVTVDIAPSPEAIVQEIRQRLGI